ncbi:bactericidal permeability-increasing protein-like [Manacus vitellinus]|uniref:bactericidal permeability-increasing protein-like n=1 Tax=Manacus vitellinus TaxID=328815 RepID=UPI00115E253E|nr:bactericidal permeability-increasing protein-like [Manacus vitellinus]
MVGPAVPVMWDTLPACHAFRCQHRPRGVVWLCLLLLLPVCVPATVTNPGIKAWLTRSSLEFGRRFGLELFQSTLQKEHELNLTGSYNIPLLGNLTYAVPRIHIHELQMNDSTLDFAEDVGVRLMVQRAQIQLSADWAAQLGAIQDSGSVELRMRDLAVAAVLGVSDDGGGRPTVWSAGCDTHGTDLHMEFHRGYSWIYNLLAPLLQRTLRQQLNKQLCLELQRGIDKLDAALKHMKVSTQLDAFAAIDYSLLGPPAFTAEHGDIALKGEIFRVGMYQQRRSALPVALPMSLPVSLPVALPLALPTLMPKALPVAREPMLLMAVTEFVANSAAFTYFTAGALSRNISSDMLPQRFPFQLRTKSMGVFSPQGQFPSLCLALTLIFSFRLSVTQVASNVGPVEVKRLETLLKFGLWLFGVPRANKWLQAGIPLPLPQGLSLLRPRVSLQEDFVLIATDLQYEP